MERSAIFSRCRTFRYILSRSWNKNTSTVLFIGLNPSEANEVEDDPTVRRCIRFARDWNFGGLYIVNLFAFCSPNPKALLKVNDPIGPKNDEILRDFISKSDKIVLIWGNNGSYLKRTEKVMKLIKNPLCLKINKNGTPAHPLYLKSGLKPIPYLQEYENHYKQHFVT